MADPHCDEEALFHAARRLQPPPQREQYLRGACGDDPALLGRVRELLRAYDEDQSLGDVRLGPAADAVEEMPHPRALVGRYRLLEQIGEGGFGVVYMAEQQHPVRRRVALKVIKAGMDTRQVIARFEAERQALALMDHPNIAQVYDAGETDAGRPYFVMELVRGVPLTEYCDRNNLNPRQRLELFVQVCQAVQHAHQKGVIHRDLKPGNVLVTLHDARPVPKVIDFGIAKATGQQLTDKTLFTQFAQMVGTPLYMSPEQAELSGLDADTRSDVYSLGVLLYELLTGTTPFGRERLKTAALDEVRRIIREEQPPKPSTRIGTLGATLRAVSGSRSTEPKKLGPLVRGELDCIVMKAMEKDRNRRYVTANALAVDVRRYLDNEPVSARPASRVYRLRKFASKHKLGFAAGASVAAALVLGIIGTSAGLVRASWARRGAEREAMRAVRAEQVANEQKTLAQHQADRATALNDFMRLVLSSAGPARDGRDVRVADLLDAAATDLDARFRDQPDLEVAARQALRGAYDNLGLAEQSGHNLRRAYEASRSAYGEDSPETLRLAADVSRLLTFGNNIGEAETLARAAYGRARRVLGPGHHVTLSAGSALAHALGEQSRTAESEGLLRELIRDTPTPRDELAHERLSDLAMILDGRGEKAEAARLMYQALDTARATGRDEVMYRLYVALRLGKMLASRGRPDEAEGVYVSVLSDPVVLAGQFTVHARSRVPNSLEKEFSRVLRDYAALLEARGKAGDATRVRAEHLARLRAAVPPSGSDSPSALTRRARLLARVGQFKEAADDYARAIELDPGDHWRWYPLGCLLAYADQPDAYRDHCRAMLRRFGASTDRFIAGRTAKTCLLLPGVTPDLTPQLRLVDVVLAPGANQQHMPWFRQLKGIAEYRRGHFAAAIESFEQSRRLLPADFETSEAVALLFLAMSHHQLGHAERARGLLAEARGMMEQKVPKAGVDDLEASLIEFWLVCHVIRREAEALFAGG